MQLDPLKLLIIASFSSLYLFLGTRYLSGLPEKKIFVSFFAFFFLYNGLGVVDKNTDTWLVLAFVLFCIFLYFSILIGHILFSKLGRTVARADPYFRATFSVGKIPIIFLGLFLLIKLSTLVFPEFKLHLLLFPPEPDIRAWFEGQLVRGQIGFISYLEILVLPFFYLALQRIRHRPIALFALLLFPIYVDYVNDAYIGRYRVAFALLFYGLYIWSRYRKLRVLIVLLSPALVLILLVMFQIYAQVRQGVPLSLAFDSVEVAVTTLFESETTFLQRTGNYVIASGERVDILSYLTWLITLPVPGFLKSGLEVSLINFEMSEISLGLSRAEPGFYVLLPGLLVESIYIFGGFFYFHAVFIGLLVALAAQLYGRAPNLGFLNSFFIVAFGLVLNRGGVSAFAPTFFNSTLLLILLIIVLIAYGQSKRRGEARLNVEWVKRRVG